MKINIEKIRVRNPFLIDLQRPISRKVYKYNTENVYKFLRNFIRQRYQRGYYFSPIGQKFGIGAELEYFGYIELESIFYKNKEITVIKPLRNNQYLVETIYTKGNIDKLEYNLPF